MVKMLAPVHSNKYESQMSTERKIYYNKRILLSESFDMNFPIDRDSDSDTEVESSNLFGSDLKSENLYVNDHIDHNISNISGNHYMLDDSMSQIIATSFLDEIRSEDASFNEENRMVNDEWNKQIQLQNLNEGNIRGTFQDTIKTKLELSNNTPRHTEHDVYYLFQYHYIEHAIDWLFLPEEPYILIELLSDQQAIYANRTLTMITEKMPEGEIMP